MRKERDNMRTLIVIDMQEDFVSGALGTREAQAIVPNVRRKIESYRKRGDQILFTRDTHEASYADTQEGRWLPVPHCIRGTSGWELLSGLSVPGQDQILDKPSFGYDWSAGMASGEVRVKGEEIEIVGLCTDICVITNALSLKTVFPERKITVDASCCAGVTPESHKNALDAMRICQIYIEESVLYD